MSSVQDIVDKAITDGYTAEVAITAARKFARECHGKAADESWDMETGKNVFGVAWGVTAKTVSDLATPLRLTTELTDEGSESYRLISKYTKMAGWFSKVSDEFAAGRKPDLTYIVSGDGEIPIDDMLFQKDFVMFLDHTLAPQDTDDETYKESIAAERQKLKEKYPTILTD